jgi:hypothetical protein
MRVSGNGPKIQSTGRKSHCGHKNDNCTVSPTDQAPPLREPKPMRGKSCSAHAGHKSEQAEARQEHDKDHGKDANESWIGGECGKCAITDITLPT